MLKPLRYFFFRVYEWKRRSQPPSVALFSALAATSVAVCMHVLALRVLLSRVMQVDFGIEPDRATSRALAIALGFLVMAAFYRAWISSNRYVSFAEEFRAETTQERRRRTVLVIVYAVASFLLPFALMIVLPK